MTHAQEVPPRGLALCNLLMCGILRTFTRQPYFVQQVKPYASKMPSSKRDGAEICINQKQLKLRVREDKDAPQGNGGFLYIVMLLLL